jgi:hypothetical protein
MTSWGPPDLVDGPVPQPPYRSLVNSVELAATGDDRWINGVALRPWSSQCALTYDYCGAKPATMSDGVSGTPSGSAADLEFGSFAVYLPETCTSRGIISIDDFKRRAQVVLAAVEPAAVEKELESGGALQTANRFLRDANVQLVDGDNSHNVVEGFARLERAIANKCRRGMIHCTVEVMIAASAQHLLENDPTNPARLITQTGTIVVPGQGYTGAAPAGGTTGSESQWAYATGMIELRRSGIEMDPPDDAAESLKRSDNTITYRALRYWNIAWDGALQAAVKIDRTTTNP